MLSPLASAQVDEKSEVVDSNILIFILCNILFSK
jgi:hypothetical protein